MTALNEPISTVMGVAWLIAAPLVVQGSVMLATAESLLITAAPNATPAALRADLVAVAANA